MLDHWIKSFREASVPIKIVTALLLTAGVVLMWVAVEIHARRVKSVREIVPEVAVHVVFAGDTEARLRRVVEVIDFARREAVRKGCPISDHTSLLLALWALDSLDEIGTSVPETSKDGGE